MKYRIIMIVLAWYSFYSTAMESLSIASSNQQQHQSDTQRIVLGKKFGTKKIDVPVNYLQQSITLKNMLEDITTQTESIPLTMISYKAWKTLIPYMQQCAQSAAQQNAHPYLLHNVKQALFKEDDAALKHVINNAHFLEIPSLYTACCSVLTHHLLQPSYLKHFANTNFPNNFNPFALDHNNQDHLLTFLKQSLFFPGHAKRKQFYRGNIITWHPKSTYFAADSEGKKVCIVSMKSNNRYTQTEHYSLSTEPHSLIWHPTSEVLIIGQESQILFYDVYMPHQPKLIYCHLISQDAGYQCLRLNPKNNLLAAGKKNGAILVYQIENDFHNLTPVHLCYHDNGAGIITSSEHNPKKRIVDLAWICDGTVLASASADGTIKMWDLTTKKLVPFLTLDDAFFTAYAKPRRLLWNNQYYILAVVDDQLNLSLINLVDLMQPKRIYQTPIHHENTVTWNYDGTLLAFSLPERKKMAILNCLNPDHPFLQAILEPHQTHYPIEHFAVASWSPDGKTLMAGGNRHHLFHTWKNEYDNTAINTIQQALLLHYVNQRKLTEYQSTFICRHHHASLLPLYNTLDERIKNLAPAGPCGTCRARQSHDRSKIKRLLSFIAHH